MAKRRSSTGAKRRRNSSNVVESVTTLTTTSTTTRSLLTTTSGEFTEEVSTTTTTTVAEGDELQIADCCHHTHPWKTFDFEQVRSSARFAYLADPYMRRGYSIQKRRRDVFLSLFACHNETVNVWSHLLGGILFVVLFFSWYVESEPTVRMSQMAHDSFESLTHHLHEITIEAKKYSDVLSEEAAALRWRSQAAAENLALRLSSLPADLRAEMLRQQSVLGVWLAEEKAAAEAAIHSFEKQGADWLRRTAVVEWISMHAKSNDTNIDMDQLTQVLRDKLSSFIPRDFEARRAAAALRGWLADERRTIENLLFRFDPQSTSTPVWPVLVFCFGGVMCLGCSAVYHWWLGYCRHYHDTLCRVDLAGISFMIWGSCVPLIYYVFYEDDFWRNLYLVVTTVLCGATLAFCALPADLLHRVKGPRVLSYVAAGAFVIAPLIHSIIRWGAHSDQVRRYLNDGYLALVGFLYVLGAVIYISRFPERFFPGTFDLLFASHQIWHALVFLAAYVHYFGAVELYLWRVEKELHSSEILMNASGLLG